MKLSPHADVCAPTIVDYGVGNVESLRNMIEFIGGDCHVSRDEDDISRADKLILPGVGAFDHAIQQLHASGLRDSLDKAVLERKVPVLGVCLGMQLLGEGSEEGQLPGLGWIEATSCKFETQGRADLKVPNNGWCLATTRRDDCLMGIAGSLQRYYFNHSYYVECEHPEDVVATFDFAGDICCAVQRDNVWGVQFHPEKSHRSGMELMSRFLQLQVPT